MVSFLMYNLGWGHLGLLKDEHNLSTLLQKSIIAITKTPVCVMHKMLDWLYYSMLQTYSAAKLRFFLRPHSIYRRVGKFFYHTRPLAIRVTDVRLCYSQGGRKQSNIRGQKRLKIVDFPGGQINDLSTRFCVAPGTIK